jgi:glycosyltransferase involved in cell wall biosynthesis
VSPLRLVCLAGLPWQGRPSTWYHLSNVLRRDHEVLFVDPPVSILRQPFRRARRHDVDDRLRIFQPPPVLYRVPTGLNGWRYGRAVATEVARLGWDDTILWNVAPIQLTEPAVTRTRHRLHVLHFTDAFWDFPGWDSRAEAAFDRLRTRTAVAIGTSPAIVERLSNAGYTARLLPQGVDVDRFAPVARGEVAPAAALTDLPRPIVGFLGRLDRRLDLDIVEALARSFPSVVLVGPSNLGEKEHARLASAGAILPGPIPYDGTPSWLAGFDVAVLPYRSLPSVLPSQPLKLLEYVAAGVATVSTDIPFAREWRPHVRVAATLDAFIDAVADAVANPLPAEQRAARPHYLADWTWANRAREFTALIDEAAARPQGVA